MDAAQLLVETYGRIPELVEQAVTGLDEEQLAYRVDPAANSIAWLVWHLARVEDDHVSEVAGREQAWTADGWAERFALPFDLAAHGYGQDAAEVGQVRAGADLLLGYYRAVSARSLDYLATLTDADLDRVVDDRWDPPVTLGVRLVSVVDDAAQHAGQAAYVRGVIERTTTA